MYENDDVVRLAAKLGMDLLDARGADEGVLYVVPYGDGYEPALDVFRELLGQLTDRGRVVEVEAIRAERGIGFVLRDVTPVAA